MILAADFAQSKLVSYDASPGRLELNYEISVRGHPRAVCKLTDNEFAVTESDVVRIRSMSTGEILRELGGGGARFAQVLDASNDGGNLFVGTTVRATVFDAVTCSEVHTIGSCPMMLTGMRFCPEWAGRLFLAGGCSPKYRVVAYDVEKQVALKVLPVPRGVTDLVIDAEGSRLFAVASAGTVHAWSADSMQSIGRLDLGRKGRSGYFVSERQLLLVGLNNGSVQLWDMRMTSKKLGCHVLGSGGIYGFARITDDVLVMISQDMLVWRTDGTPLCSAGRRKSHLVDVTSIGTPYDRPPGLKFKGSDDFVDRSEFVAQVVLQKPILLVEATGVRVSGIRGVLVSV